MTRLQDARAGLRQIKDIAERQGMVVGMDAHAALSAPKVVVVDDDAAVLNALGFALDTEGFRVQVFRTARSMFADAEAGRAACLVIDQILPDEPGLDLIARLRARGDRTPAVLITTNPPQAVLSYAARLGVPIVEKPLLGDHLFACIRDLVAAQN